MNISNETMDEITMEQETMVTIGTIVDIDRENRNFTTTRNGDFVTMIRFNVPEETLFFDCFGGTIQFDDLSPKMSVSVCHANFMTASLPPQTTAYEVCVLVE